MDEAVEQFEKPDGKKVFKGMITHYGLFWSEKDVFWTGNKGANGSLLGREREPLGRRGRPAKGEQAAEREYRDFVGLYCLYGGGQLLYIGEAGLGTNRTLFSRLKEHRRGPMAGRWDHFSWFGREKAEGDAQIKDALGQLEAIVIAIINPGFNRQSGTFAGAKQVFQVAHKRSEGDLETKINRLSANLEALAKGMNVDLPDKDD